MTALALEVSPIVTLVGGGEDLVRLGTDIKTRRESYGMSPGGLAELAGVTRSTIYQVEKGKSLSRTAQVVNAALRRFEEEHGVVSKSKAAEEKGSQLVTYRVQAGALDVDVTVAGPVDNIPELEASISRLIEQLGRDAEDDDN